jgi:hypothetical protein
MNRSRIVIACALLLASGIAAADQVYKWVDSQGHVHFSQTPPPNATTGVQQMNVAPVPPDPQSLQNQQNMVNTQQDQQQKAKDQADKDKPDPKAEAAKKQQCDAIRSRLQVLQRGGRISTTDTQGNITYVDDDARAKQIAALQGQLAKDCGGN